MFLCFSPIEKPIWYYAEWRRSASTAGPSCAAPTSRAAPTLWHTSTAGTKRGDLPATHGMDLYMTVAPHAWRSSFLYSATHTATPNSDETGVWRRVVRLCFFSLQNGIFDWCTSSVSAAAGVSHVTGAFLKTRREQKKIQPQNSLDIGLKLPENKKKKTYFCVAYFYYMTEDYKKNPWRNVGHISLQNASDCTYQWEPAVWNM